MKNKIAIPFDHPFRDAIDYFTSQGCRISPRSWRDLWQQAHAGSFTVARGTAMDVLEDIKEALEKAMREGMTLEQLTGELEPVLERKGWLVPSGQDDEIALEDGTFRKRLSGWRLDTICRTNMHKAYSVGRYLYLQQVAAERPYWQYHNPVDERSRISHAAMNGKVFHHLHPVWRLWYPPNGFNCRCWITSLSRWEMEDQGISEQTTAPDDIPDEGWRYNPGEAGLQAWQPDYSRYNEIERGLVADLAGRSNDLAG